MMLGKIQMNEDKKRRLLRILYITFSLSLIIVWGQSTISKADSKTESDTFVELVRRIRNIKPESFDDVTYSSISTLVRKVAHVIEYSVLMLQLMWIFLLRGKNRKTDYINCIFIGMLIALTDETIQIFANRGSLVSDVWIDMAGIVIGIGAARLVRAIKMKKHKPAQEQ